MNFVFWVIAQRRFGTDVSGVLTLENWTDGLSRNVGG